MISDYHVHTPYCGHAQGKTIDYIETAVGLGMKEIGFSDHLGRYYLGKNQKKRYWDWGMRERDMARYFSELLDLKETYGDRIAVRIGLEIDYIEGAEHLAEEIVSQYPFDYLLGSIHCLPILGWRHLSEYVKVDAKRVYEAYFGAVKSAARSGLFQSLAHMDFLWRYVAWPDAPASRIEEYISESVALAAAHGTCIEVNANGFLWSQMEELKKFDLFDVLLEQVKKHQACITVGSDAHTPELVGKSFPQINSLLQSKGFQCYSVFEQKQRKQVKLG
ncbi:MAG TPA: histidinol-phosphatase [Chitinivibrionales bacterium]|nr:histidinol-phosphatase [Chitinivibrionales bacterium]